MPITKHNFLVTQAEDIPRALAEAFHIASTGRPGPVLVDVAKDAMQASAPFHWPVELNLPGYRPVSKPHGKQIREAARLISQSKRPVLYVGGGVLKAHATGELLALAELTGAPVVTTLMALGAFPDTHEQHLGMPGMHGSVAAVTALQKSDLIVALGARFDDRVTGKLSSFAPEAKVVHADIDPAETSGEPCVCRRADRGRLPRGADRTDHGRARRAGGRPGGRLHLVVGVAGGLAHPLPAGLRDGPGRTGPAVRDRADRQAGRTGRDLHHRRGPAPDVGRAVHLLREALHLPELRRRRDDGIRGARRDGRQGRPAGGDRLVPSTAFAASR